MLRIVRMSSIATTVALCFVSFTFAEAQQQAEPAGQAAPAAQGGQQETPGSRPPTADELSQDRCWNRSPCWENRRPPVAFKEDWTDPNAGQPYDYKDRDLDAHLQNNNLTMVRYGVGAEDVIYDRHVQPLDESGYIWLGACAAGPCVITIKDKNDYLNLAVAGSKVVWRTKQGGYRQLRLVLKLADGTFLISDRYAGPSEDWNVSEISMLDVHWRRLIIREPTRIYEEAPVDQPDLSRVDEIGFTDLMVGGPSFFGGTSRIDWIEVHAERVARPAGSTNDGN